MSTPDTQQADHIKACAQDLCRHATDMGLNVTITREPVNPLAMGNAVYKIDVWPIRQTQQPSPLQKQARKCREAYNDEYHKVPPRMSLDEWSGLWLNGQTPPQVRAAAAARAVAPGFTRETNGLDNNFPSPDAPR